jgi:hypothetical protein
LDIESDVTCNRAVVICLKALIQNFIEKTKEHYETLHENVSVTRFEPKNLRVRIRADDSTLTFAKNFRFRSEQCVARSEVSFSFPVTAV